MQVYDLARSDEQFDLVWFMGVFYHLRYPLLALDILARRTRRMMMFQTLSLPGEEVYPDTQDHPITEREPLLDPGWPKMAFIEHRFSGDRHQLVGRCFLAQARPDQLVGAEPRRHRSDAALQRLARDYSMPHTLGGCIGVNLRLLNQEPT
jgi:SAM-dependent methyltransferase